MLNESLVLIRTREDGQAVVGCGACIEQNLIVTCRHVWRDVGQQGEAFFPYLNATSALELIDPCESPDGDSPDIVLLRATNAPRNLTELQVARSEAFETGKAHARAWLPTRGLDDEILGEIGAIDLKGRRPFRQGQQEATGYWFEEGSKAANRIPSRSSRCAEHDHLAFRPCRRSEGVRRAAARNSEEAARRNSFNGGAGAYFRDRPPLRR